MRSRVVVPSLFLAIAATARAAPPTAGRDTTYLERMFTRPYTGGVPLRAVGSGLWATHPNGFGFSSDVHWVHHNQLTPFDLGLTWQGQAIVAGPAVAHPAHVETFALPVGDVALNVAATGLPAAVGPNGAAWTAIDGDRGAAAPWTEVPDVLGETWLELTWSGATPIASTLLTLVDDAARAIALPSAYRLELRVAAVWEAAVEGARVPLTPGAGPNRVAFTPRNADGLRVVFSASARIGVAELEVYAPGAQPLSLVERKTIGDDDVLLSVLTATNLGDAPASLTVGVSSTMAVLSGVALVKDETIASMPVSLRLELTAAVADAPGLRRDVALAPGAPVETRVAMAFARDAAWAETRVAMALTASDPIAAKEATTAAWFLREVPQLATPDPWFDKTYAFRWLVVRRNRMDPRHGLLQHPTYAEGRWSAPWFARPITYGAPHQLRELRWLRDSREARGHALTFVDNARADGAFVGATVGAPLTEYTDWIASAIQDVYEVTGDTDLLWRSVAAMAKNVDYTLSAWDGDDDGLPVVDDHYRTGMEWQPAFFSFNGYMTDAATPLERVDYASALFANAQGVAAASLALCDGVGAVAARATAEGVRTAVESRMWDEPGRFYLSLRASDDAKADTREIVGFYPFAFGLAPAGHEDALRALFDPAEFLTSHPPASSSLTCPATSQNGWPIGPGGSAAMWNGPTWPHATSVVAEAVANAIRRSGEGDVTRAQLFALLESYTRANYWGTGANRDFTEPFIGEYYHGDIGFWKTSERDYFHSTYADLLITQLVGLVPGPGADVRVDPLLPPATWAHFLLENVRYRGHDVTIAWDEPGGVDHFGDGREGLDLWIDGLLQASRPDLGLLSAPLRGAVLYATRDVSGDPRFTQAGATPWTLFRASRRDLDGAAPLSGGPFTTDAATDTGSPGGPGVWYYRQGGCGDGL